MGVSRMLCANVRSTWATLCRNLPFRQHYRPTLTKFRMYRHTHTTSRRGRVLVVTAVPGALFAVRVSSIRSIVPYFEHQAANTHIR